MAHGVRSRFLLPLALFLLTPLTCISQMASFDLPAEPLAESLKAVGAQSNVNVMVSPALVDGKQAPALKAQLSVRDALARLLSGTGLEYHFVNERTVVIREKRPAAEAISGAAGQPIDPTTQNTNKESGKNSSQSFRVGPADHGHAQEADPIGRYGSRAAAGPEMAGGRLEEIVVTAQKRQERLIDTPQSVSVLLGSQLSDLGASQLRDYAGAVPGLSLQSEGAGMTQLSLRGVTVGKDAGETVGIYIDDVPYGSSSTFARGGQVTIDPDLFDLDRIEVLRGPQGTLYGAATLGGLVKYVTRAPDTSRFYGQARAGTSDTESGGVGYEAAAMVNLPIETGVMALRVSGFETHDGGYMDNVTLGSRDVDRSDIYGGRIDLAITPVDRLRIRVSGFLQDTTRGGFPTTELTYAGPAGSELQQHRYVSEPFHQHFQLVSATGAYDFGPATLTSISSYQQAPTQFDADLTGSFAPLCALVLHVSCTTAALVDRTNTDKFTQEIRLASSQAARLSGLLGGYYTHESSSFDQTFALTGAGGGTVANGILANAIPSTYEESAAFADLTWRLIERLDLSGGVRYAASQTTFSQIGSGALGRSGPTTQTSSDVFTYLANARYRPTDNQTAYIRYATGYRPGGPNFLVLNPTTGQPIGAPTFQPDRLKSYEAGYKAVTDDGRLSLDLSGYHIDWDNIIVTVTVAGFNARANAPGAKIDGAEATLTGRPLKHLKLAAAAAYTDARLSDQSLSPLLTAGLRASPGQRLPTVPRFTGSLGVEYEFDSALSPTVGASASYIDARPASFGNPAYTLPAFTTVDLHGGLTFGSTQVQLYARNLFDVRGQLTPRVVGASTTSSLTTPFQVTILEPRTVGIRATASF